MKLNDEELLAIAAKSGICWVGDDTAHMHSDTMRIFAEALMSKECERLQQDRTQDPSRLLLVLTKNQKELMTLLRWYLFPLVFFSLITAIATFGLLLMSSRT